MTFTLSAGGLSCFMITHSTARRLRFFGVRMQPNRGSMFPDAGGACMELCGYLVIAALFCRDRVARVGGADMTRACPSSSNTQGRIYGGPRSGSSPRQGPYAAGRKAERAKQAEAGCGVAISLTRSTEVPMLPTELLPRRRTSTVLGS